MDFLRWLAGLLAPHALPPYPPPTPAPARAVASTGPATPEPATIGVVAALNRERAAYRLAPLGEDTKLADSAAAWAAEMARRGALTHGDFSGGSPQSIRTPPRQRTSPRGPRRSRRSSPCG